MTRRAILAATLLVALSVVLIPVSDTAVGRSSRKQKKEARAYSAARDLEGFILRFRKLAIHHNRNYVPVSRLVLARKQTADLARDFKSAVNPSYLDDKDWIDYFLLRSSFIRLLERYDEAIAREKEIAALMPFETILYSVIETLYNDGDGQALSSRRKIDIAYASIAKFSKKFFKTKGWRLYPGVLRRVQRLRHEFYEWSRVTAGVVPGFEKECGKRCSEINKALEFVIKNCKDKMKRDKFYPEIEPVGAEKFKRLLVINHHETDSIDELYAYGQKCWLEVNAQLAACAAKIDPSKSYLEIIEDMRSHHPAQGEVALAYDAMMASLRKFFEAKKIITLPDNIFETVRTVRFLDSDKRVPFASYNRDALSGRMNVAVPSLDTKAKDREAKLRSQNYYFMFVVVPHETVPGHHLQLSLAASLIRPRIGMRTTFFVEGWAFYCEELMYDQGFFERKYQPTGWNLDPAKIQLYQLKWRLHRVARLLIDIGWHTGRVTQAEAEKMLIEKVGLHPNDARAEVGRYMWTPTQPMSYMIGKRDIVAIREAYLEKRKLRYSLRDFHDSLLSYGSVPPVLIHAVMLGERETVQKRLDKALSAYE